MAAERLVRGPVHREEEDFCQNMFYPSGPRNELFGCRGLPLRVTYIILYFCIYLQGKNRTPSANDMDFLRITI